jgi:hypothetical protein
MYVGNMKFLYSLVSGHKPSGIRQGQGRAAGFFDIESMCLLTLRHCFLKFASYHWVCSFTFFPKVPALVRAFPRSTAAFHWGLGSAYAIEP